MDETLMENYHAVLAKSYITFFMASTIGLLLDTLLQFHFSIPRATLIAIICFIVGPVLIMWAQYASRHTGDVKTNDMLRQYFYRGPYRYLRNPTQLGLLILVAGFAIVTQSPILFAASLTAYIISNIFFRQYERLLEKKFGERYTEYRTSVRKIL